MAPEHVHVVAHDRGRRPISRLRPCAFTVDFFPHAPLEVELEHVGAVVAIVAAENEHISVVDHSGVGVTGTGSCFLVGGNDSGPLPFSDREFVEVVDAVESVIAREYVDVFVRVADGCVPVTRGGRLAAGRENLSPGIGAEIEAEEVVSSVRSIVSAEYVEHVLDGHRGVQRPRAGRVTLVPLLRLQLVPRARVFEQWLLVRLFETLLLALLILR